jgi:hypothetical protein
MTDILKIAFEAASRLPADRQAELARFVLAVSDVDRGGLSVEAVAAIAEAEAEIASGQTATPDAVNAFWRRHGL